MERADRIPEVELLLEDRTWACRLARSLVHDEHLAEDIVQAAYLATLEQPAPPPARRRAWFAGVVRNLSRMALRSGGRRQRREDAAPLPPPVPSSAELASRAEQHQRLASLVLELDEPYRSVVLLRYFGGLEPAEIAAHTREPAGTIRSRLKRGLEKLRTRLEEREGGSWRALLVPLAADPAAVVRITSTVSAAAATVAVVKVLLASLLLLAAGTLTWRVFNPADDEAPRHAPAPSVPPAADRDAVADSGGDRKTIRSRRGVDPSAGALTGRVVDRNGQPVAGARVVIFPADIDQTVNASNLDPGGPAQADLTDAFGRYEIVPVRASGIVNLYAEARGFSPVVLESRKPSEDPTLVLEPASRLAGTVRDSDGRPIPGARVRWHAVVCGVALVREAAPAGDDGTYEVADVMADGPGLATSQAPISEVVFSAPGYAAAHLAVPLPDAEGHIRLDAVLARGVVLTGSVVDAATQTPLAGAKVAFWTQRERTAAPGPMGRALPDPTPVAGLAETTTDAAGRFRLADLPWTDAGANARARGVAGIVGAASPGYSAAVRIVSFASGAPGDLVLACTPAARVRGRLVDANGAGVEGVALWLEPRLATHHYLPQMLAGRAQGTTSGPHGHFEFDDVGCDAAGRGALEIVGRPRGLLGMPFRRGGVTVRPGETTDAGEIPIATIASVDVRVVQADDVPIFGARVTLAPFYDGEDFEGHSVATDVNGRATVHSFEKAPGSGFITVRIFAQHPAYARGSGFVNPADPKREIKIVLMPDHSLRGRVIDEDGTPVLNAQVWLVDARVPKDQAFSYASELETAAQYLPPKFGALTRTRAEGRFVVRGLAATKFHVAARRTTGWDRETSVLWDVETDRDEIVVKLPPVPRASATGDLEIAVLDAATGRPVVDARVAAVNGAGNEHRSEDAMGVHRFERLPAGAYTIMVQAPGRIEQTLSDVAVASGSSRFLELRLESGITVRGSVRRSDGLPFASSAVLGMLGDDAILPPITGRIDEDGTFAVDGVVPSRLYSVAVMEPGPLGLAAVFVPADRKRVEIPADSAKSTIQITVIPASVVWFRLEGGSDSNKSELLRGARLIVENEAGMVVFERGHVYRPSVPVSLPRGSYRAALLRGDQKVDSKRFEVVTTDSLEIKLSLE